MMIQKKQLFYSLPEIIRYAIHETVAIWLLYYFMSHAAENKPVILPLAVLALLYVLFISTEVLQITSDEVVIKNFRIIVFLSSVKRIKLESIAQLQVDISQADDSTRWIRYSTFYIFRVIQFNKIIITCKDGTTISCSSMLDKDTLQQFSKAFEKMRTLHSL